MEDGAVQAYIPYKPEVRPQKGALEGEIIRQGAKGKQARKRVFTSSEEGSPEEVRREGEGLPRESAKRKRQRLSKDTSHTERRELYVLTVSRWLMNRDPTRPSPLGFGLCLKAIQDILHISSNYLYKRNKEGKARIEAFCISGRIRKKMHRDGLFPLDNLAAVCIPLTNYY